MIIQPTEKRKISGSVLRIPMTGNPIFRSEKRIMVNPPKQIAILLNVNFTIFEVDFLRIAFQLKASSLNGQFQKCLSLLKMLR